LNPGAIILIRFTVYSVTYIRVVNKRSA